MTIEFGLAFACSTAIDGVQTLEICRRAEAAGFESLWGGEHVILPSTIDSPYPYSNEARSRPSPTRRFPTRCGWPMSSEPFVQVARTIHNPERISS